jgi:predicted Fe-S protein YdhL (DUF1289 family)
MNRAKGTTAMQLISTENISTNSQSNPCKRNCCLNDDRVCLGCGRSLPEILEWHHADNSRQQKIKMAAQERLSERKAYI